MKIEKKKVSQNKILSTAAKSAIAATFGMAAAFTLNACDDSTSANSEQGDDTVTPNPESSAQVEPGSSAITEGPAASSQVESTQSSSSKVVDIPLSHESLSSEALEALSSAAEPGSSETAAISVADNPTSSAAAPSSSDVKPTSSEGSDVVPGSSSNVAPSSSSRGAWGDWDDPSSSSVDISDVCPDDDPWCIQIHMCDNQYGCMAASMVTTFERDDITG